MKFTTSAYTTYASPLSSEDNTDSGSGVTSSLEAPSLLFANLVLGISMYMTQGM